MVGLPALAMCIVSWQIRAISKLTSNTVIRLWNAIHVQTHIAHDFSKLLNPNNYTHIAAIKNDEILSIGCCCENNSLISIASAPNESDAILVLIMYCIEQNMTINWKDITGIVFVE